MSWQLAPLILPSNINKVSIPLLPQSTPSAEAIFRIGMFLQTCASFTAISVSTSAFFTLSPS